MDTNEIKLLIDRFYDGQTSEQEEQTLRAWAATAKPSYPLYDEALVLREMLAAEPLEPSQLEVALAQKIDRWEQAERPKQHRTINLRRWLWTAAAIALLALVVGVTLKFLQPTEAETIALDSRDTYDNPEDAKEATLLALSKFQQCIEKNAQQTQKVLQKTNINLQK